MKQAKRLGLLRPALMADCFLPFARSGAPMAMAIVMAASFTCWTASLMEPETDSPEGYIRVLTANGPLALDGNTRMEIAKENGQTRSDLVTGVTILNYGGTLTLTSSGDLLAAGDVFTLFEAELYCGGFSCYHLPALEAGLAWDTTRLTADGSITVGLAGAVPPVLVSSPHKFTASVGDTVQFRAGAAGSEPITFQWFCNGSLLSSPPDSATLILSSAQETDRGQYWLVAQNAAGSVTSAPVVLTVMPRRGSERFDAVVNNGAGKMPGMKYNFGMHSSHLVPLYAKGNGSELFNQFATNTDLVRGLYLDNTDVNRVLRTVLTNGVKNIILMISDGAGFSAYEAASYYQHGELGRQVYDGWPVQLACATSPLTSLSSPSTNQSPASTRGWYGPSIWEQFYHGTSNWTDSSAAATALSCGQKTYNFAIGWSDDNQPLPNISEAAKQVSNKKVGIVTTVPISHPTPAAFSAHNPSRMAFQAIAAEQLTNRIVDVLMGAGHPLFDDNNSLTNEADYSYVGGQDMWNSLANGALGWNLIQTRDEFEALADGRIILKGRVCGVAQVRSTLQQARGPAAGDYGGAGGGREPAFAVPFNSNVPDLPTMARGALHVLADENPNGFFLMIEGGAIDLASHSWQQGRMIEEQIGFNAAVETVENWVSAHGGWDENLVIVISDHETGLLFGPGAGGLPIAAATSLSPSGVAGLVMERGNMRLTWSAVLGATSYLVNVIFPDLTTSSYVSSTNWFTLTNMSLGTYSWNVTPVNSFGQGPISPSTSFTVWVQGLVGVGRIRADSFDARGPGLDTLGGIGSAVFFDGSTWTRTLSSGGGYTYSGTLYSAPDRGFGDGTQDFLPRIQTLDFSITPYYGTGLAPQTQISLKNTATLLLTYDGTYFTGYDADDPTVREFPQSSPSSPGQGHLSLDAEGLVRLSDGSFFLSDEYGPFIYKFSARGELEYTMQPPDALLPRNGHYPGIAMFTATNALSSGRRYDRGLEGLSITPDGTRLFAMLESPAVQDDGANNSSRNTRILIFDVDLSSPTFRQPIAEYAYPLTLNGNDTTNRHTPAHEILALNSTDFLVLECDNRGLGAGPGAPIYKRIVLASTAGATNLINTAYDLEKGAQGQLSFKSNSFPTRVSTVRRTDLIDLIDTNQLAKFGLNISTNQDANTMSEKWESLALIPLNDPEATNDFLLLTLNDNDYTTPVVCHNGAVAGTNNSSVDTMALAYRIRLPMYGAPKPANQPPNVVLTIPTNATLSAPAIVTLTANAYDQDGRVIRVAFFDNGNWIGEATSFPFQITLAGCQPGDHAFVAVATDNENDIDISPPQTVVVTGTNQLPFVTIMGPTNLALSAPAFVTLGATAGDADGWIARVEFYDGNTRLGQDTNAPYSLAITGVEPGLHLYSAVSVDNHGSNSPPAEYGVVVASENIPPHIELISPIHGAVFYAPASFTLTALAGDLDGRVAKVEFFRNNTRIATLTNAPWQVIASTQPVGLLTYHAVATDNQGQDTISSSINVTINKAVDATPFTLQILHASDLDAGLNAVFDAPAFSSVLGALQSQYPTNTIRLLSGNNFLSGVFYQASGDPSAGFNGVQGRADIALLNAMGFQASAFGNHDFDVGTEQLHSLLARDPVVNYPGALFPYLSANLDFSLDTNIASLVSADGQLGHALSNRVAKSCILSVAGQMIGIVGATMSDLQLVSSPGAVQVDTNVTQAVQTAVDGLLAQGVNKIVVLAHLGQYTNEMALARQLRDVDVVIAGGSHAIFAKPADHLRTGDTASMDYPAWVSNIRGEPVAVASAGANYAYAGRLVLTFDTNGLVSCHDPASGVYATDSQGLANTGRYPADPTVLNIANTIGSILSAQDGNVFGYTTVYLNGQYEDGCTEETNLGSLAADANLWRGQQTDPAASISLRNGGGICNSIGALIDYAGGVLACPPLPNWTAGKQFGQISQLDIVNALNYNDSLILLTLTAQQLRDTIEWSVAGTAPGAAPGQFPQVSGLRFSFCPTNPPMTYTSANLLIDGIATPGSRVQSLVARRHDGSLDLVVDKGVLIGDPSRAFRMVTLDYLANGGDNYYPLTRAMDRVNLVSATRKTFTTDGAEQWALAAYLAHIEVYSQADTPPSQDQRIQNLLLRSDTVTSPRLMPLTPGTNMTLSFTTLPGKWYQVWSAGDIRGPWQNITPTPIAGTGQLANYVDNAPVSHQTFYRVVELETLTR